MRLRFKSNEFFSKLLVPTDKGVVVVDLHHASMALNGNYLRLKKTGTRHMLQPSYSFYLLSTPSAQLLVSFISFTGHM